MNAMSDARDRVICVTLSEAEWQAFVARHPQPVSWLKERIRNEVGLPPVDTTGTRSTTSAKTTGSAAV